ncbi:BppU family phage baseplate upper protein [Weissella confusa]|uniref:BppU family phage baseplate upper protein n=1 Tax=Weissella confusa TaxID=1583 RepID=UPI0018F1401F|nr:BppU family phage baseplate upper protein [Weissella confusa]
MATQAQSQGRYAVVNTLLDTTDVTLIDSLSGRQGDNGRIVYFAIKDGNLPHNLDGQNVVLTAKDSAGKVKQISGVHDMISATGGLFSMLIPGEMYQSAGDIEEAYLSVQDGAGTVISSIPVTFTVLANNLLFTANASKDYIDSVQQAVNEANSRISGLNDNIKAQQLAYETLKTSVENLAGQIDSKQVALLNVANHFTDTATFDKGITASNVTSNGGVTAKTISTPNFKSDGTSIQQSRDGKTWHNLADDDGVVHKTGVESIAGDKTFTGNLALAGTVNSVTMGDSGWQPIQLKSGATAKYVKARKLNGMVTVQITELKGYYQGNSLGNGNQIAYLPWPAKTSTDDLNSASVDGIYPIIYNGDIGYASISNTLLYIAYVKSPTSNSNQTVSITLTYPISTSSVGD